MNLVGKILVMLIFVMSIAFMAMTLAVYSTHTNWYQVVNNRTPAPGRPLGLRPQLDQARAQNTELQAQIERLSESLETERGANREALANLETEREALRQERDRLVQDERTLREENRQSSAAMEAAHETLAKLRTELASLRQDLATTQTDKDQLFDRMVALSDELFRAEGTVELERQRNLLLAEETARRKSVLDAVGADEFQPVDGIPPKVDGIILAVARDGLVELSIGSDDGLRLGNTLEVYRRGPSSSKYLGRVEVLRVTPDRAVAKIIPEFRKGLIQKEDRVATRLN